MKTSPHGFLGMENFEALWEISAGLYSVVSTSMYLNSSVFSNTRSAMEERLFHYWDVCIMQN
jgi:hypothetical protein